MFFSNYDMQAHEYMNERRREERRRARLRAARAHRPQFFKSMMATTGNLLVRTGTRLQEKFAEQADGIEPLTSAGHSRL